MNEKILYTVGGYTPQELKKNGLEAIAIPEGWLDDMLYIINAYGEDEPGRVANALKWAVRYGLDPIPIGPYANVPIQVPDRWRQPLEDMARKHTSEEDVEQIARELRNLEKWLEEWTPRMLPGEEPGEPSARSSRSDNLPAHPQINEDLAAALGEFSGLAYEDMIPALRALALILRQANPEGTERGFAASRVVAILEAMASGDRFTVTVEHEPQRFGARMIKGNE